MYTSEYAERRGGNPSFFAFKGVIWCNFETTREGCYEKYTNHIIYSATSYDCWNARSICKQVIAKAAAGKLTEQTKKKFERNCGDRKYVEAMGKAYTAKK